MSLVDIYQSCSPEEKAAIIGAGATFIAAFFGFGAVIFQIGAQGSLSRKSIGENERRRLKAEMYEDAVLSSRAMADAAIELSTKLQVMNAYFGLLNDPNFAGQPLQLPAARFPELSDGYARFSNAALKLIFLIESRQIIDSRLLIFRTALSSTLHDTRDLMYSKFVSHLIPALPVDIPNGGTFPYTPPTPQAANIIRILTEEFLDPLGDAIAYADDFVAEMQNLLLGDLFKKKIQPRQPRDPNKRAITLRQAPQLEDWFRTTSNWGKMTAAVDQETQARFANQKIGP